jgi:CHAT domain-containing protein
LSINERALGPDHQNVAISLSNLADLYGAQGRYVDALPIVQRTISRNSARKSVALPVLYDSRSQNLIAPMPALDASYTVLQRLASSAAGAAISKLAVRFAAGTDELAALVRKDQDLTAEADRVDKSILAAVSKPPAERNAAMEDQIRKRIEEIKSERGTLQDVFNQRFPNYVALSKPQPLTIEQIQALLSDEEALVTVDSDEKSYVWVITKDRAEWKELSVSAEDVTKEVKSLRAGLNPESPKPFDHKLAYRLYQQVLEPIKEIIAQKKRLSFVLYGVLTSLPPQVLITTDPNGQDFASIDWLVREYAVTVLPSIASLKVLRNEKSTVAAIKPMIGFGDPVFDRTTHAAGRPKVAALNRSLTSFYRGMIPDTNALAEALPALPETADELRAIAKVLGAKPEDIKLGEAASVTEIKHERLSNYRVVYFATHALVAGEVENFAKVKAEPALVLSIPEKPMEDDDGLLRASDVAMLKLNTDFVVLSACNTAAGDKPGAEALSGLARAFFYAGARSLVVSHWEVDSDSTVALMTGLFDALKTNPHLSHAEALRLSMLKMIDNPLKPEWAQPKYWAPFIIVGEPRQN